MNRMYLAAGAATLLATAASPSLFADINGAKIRSHNMMLVGANDLQARSAYQATVHRYPSNRYILFSGHHALQHQGEDKLPDGQPLPSLNPLTGQNEENGTSMRPSGGPSRCDAR